MRSFTLIGAALIIIGWGNRVIAEESASGFIEADSPRTGSLEGIVRFSRRVPKPGGFGFEATENVKPPLDPAARGLTSTYIYLEPMDEVAKESVESPDNSKDLSQVKMNQVGFRFTPQVMVVRAGQRVLFGNDDSSDHNVRAYSEIQQNTFNIITTTARSYTKTFKLQKTGSPIKLACDFHPHMRGWIYVVDHSNVAVTNDDGEFTIEGISPGHYRLNIIQPVVRLRSQAIIEIVAGETVRVDTAFGLEHRYYQSEPKTWIVFE